MDLGSHLALLSSDLPGEMAHGVPLLQLSQVVSGLLAQRGVSQDPTAELGTICFLIQIIELAA